MSLMYKLIQAIIIIPHHPLHSFIRSSSSSPSFARGRDGIIIWVRSTSDRRQQTRRPRSHRARQPVPIQHMFVEIRVAHNIVHRLGQMMRIAGGHITNIVIIIALSQCVVAVACLLATRDRKGFGVQQRHHALLRQQQLQGSLAIFRREFLHRNDPRLSGIQFCQIACATELSRFDLPASDFLPHV